MILGTVWSLRVVETFEPGTTFLFHLSLLVPEGRVTYALRIPHQKSSVAAEEKSVMSDN